MKRIIHFLIMLMLIAAIPASSSLYAQSASSKSRLDIKPKSAEAKSNHKLGVPFLKAPATDRLVVNRSTAINQFYRSLLTSQRSTKKSSIGETSTSSIVATSESKLGEETLQSVEKLFSNDKITISNIYPNPANESAMVDYVVSPSVTEAKLVFYNVLGSPVNSYVLDKNERKLSIRTSEYDNGIYFYQLYLDGKTLATKKLLIRHQ
ncbi:MAG: T9SS type A sorting domain-containing protein [Spirosomataceae bacterium]